MLYIIAKALLSGLSLRQFPRLRKEVRPLGQLFCRYR